MKLSSNHFDDMKIFRIKAVSNEVQWLTPIDESDSMLDLLNFDCSVKLETWKPVEFFVFNPKTPRKNFYTLGGLGALAFDKTAYEACRSYFELSGEILPSILEDQTPVFLLNITECVNALDQKKSKFDYYSDGSRGRILEYAFHTNRFSESSIFKIPETCGTEIFTYSGVKSPEDEFYFSYKHFGLKGLQFDEVFSSQV